MYVHTRKMAKICVSCTYSAVTSANSGEIHEISVTSLVASRGTTYHFGSRESHRTSADAPLTLPAEAPSRVVDALDWRTRPHQSTARMRWRQMYCSPSSRLPCPTPVDSRGGEEADGEADARRRGGFHGDIYTSDSGFSYR